MIVVTSSVTESPVTNLHLSRISTNESVSVTKTDGGSFRQGHFRPRNFSWAKNASRCMSRRNSLLRRLENPTQLGEEPTQANEGREWASRRLLSALTVVPSFVLTEWLREAKGQK